MVAEQEIIEEQVQDQVEDQVEDVQTEAQDSEEAIESVDQSADQEEAIEEEQPEELVISIGEESLTSEEDEVSKAPGWVKDLRKQHRESQKLIKEQQRQIEELKAAENKPVELGPKPTLESCDYDEDVFSDRLEAWNGKKREAEQQAAQAKQAEQAQVEAFQVKLQGYDESKQKLISRGVKDYEDAESTVINSFDEAQQSILVEGAKDSALLTYVIGKDPKRAKELSEIKNPIEFAFAVARLENQVKTQTRKPSAPPERTVKGSAPTSGMDSTLEKLRAEAERTGNYSKVTAYKRQKRNKT